VGAGSIEDACDSTPAMVDGRIFLRSDGAVYAIGAKTDVGTRPAAREP
jgi:hypothetical protein